MPAGYAPFDIANIGGTLYVTYAEQDGAKHDEVDGPGLGYVDTFDLNGNFLSRVVSNGPLNAPWGLAIAPAGFGNFGGDLLVGNFGDGTIDAYTLAGAFAGVLDGPDGNPFAVPGLWGLQFGNGGNGGDPNVLYFTAGINGERDGLFGSIAPTPEPSSVFLLAGAVAGMAWLGRRRINSTVR